MTFYRTMCVPVAEIIEGGTKEEFYKEMREILKLTVKISNLAMSAAIKQDDPREEKVKIRTYSEVAPDFPGISKVVSSICRDAEKKYCRLRRKIISGNISVPNQRLQPLPLLTEKEKGVATNLKVKDEGEWVSVTFRVPGKRWKVRLAGGSNYRRQISGIRTALAAGSVGDSRLWIDRKGKAIIGLACGFTSLERELSGKMHVASHIDHLLCATMPSSSVPFAINGDVCRRWVMEASRRQARLRQDKKFGVDRRKINKEMDSISAKYKSRMSSFCHEVSSCIVAKAVRSKVETIIVDFTVKSYIQRFTWYDLLSKIKYKAEEKGIKVKDITSEITEPDINGPHVYFILDPNANRVKIGKTKGKSNRLKTYQTFSPDAVLLAIDSRSAEDISELERIYHSRFDAHRIVNRKQKGNEVFDAEPVVKWLREVKLLGNADNLSQIAQYLDVSDVTPRKGRLKADREGKEDSDSLRLSHNAGKDARITDKNQSALAVENL